MNVDALSVEVVGIRRRCKFTYFVRAWPSHRLTEGDEAGNLFLVNVGVNLEMRIPDLDGDIVHPSLRNGQSGVDLLGNTWEGGSIVAYLETKVQFIAQQDLKKEEANAH